MSDDLKSIPPEIVPFLKPEPSQPALRPGAEQQFADAMRLVKMLDALPDLERPAPPSEHSVYVAPGPIPSDPRPAEPPQERVEISDPAREASTRLSAQARKATAASAAERAQRDAPTEIVDTRALRSSPKTSNAPGSPDETGAPSPWAKESAAAPTLLEELPSSYGPRTADDSEVAHRQPNRTGVKALVGALILLATAGTGLGVATRGSRSSSLAAGSPPASSAHGPEPAVQMKGQIAESPQPLLSDAGVTAPDSEPTGSEAVARRPGTQPIRPRSTVPFGAGAPSVPRVPATSKASPDDSQPPVLPKIVD